MESQPSIFSGVSYIIALPTVFDLIAAAAVLRNAEPGCRIKFAQSWALGSDDPATWDKGRKVVFVAASVSGMNPGITAQLLRRIVDAEHEICGVVAVRDAEHWRRAFELAGLDFDTLSIKPSLDQDRPLNSMGELIWSLLDQQVDDQTLELCRAADTVEGLGFSPDSIRLLAVASNIDIDRSNRLVVMAQALASAKQLSYADLREAAELEVICAIHDRIIATKIDLEDGVVHVDTVGQFVEMTSLLALLYDMGYEVAEVYGDAFSPNDQGPFPSDLEPQTRRFDLSGAFQQAGIARDGMRDASVETITHLQALLFSS